MDYAKIGKGILKFLGGEENIEGVTHCATRLRLVLKDEKRVKKKELEAMGEVKGVFSNGGQFQIIIGQGAVNKVYEAMLEGTSIIESNLSESKKLAMKK